VSPQAKSLRTVLVPVDGWPYSEHALPFALSIARRSGAEVVLAHVYSTLQAAGNPERLGWSGARYPAQPLRIYLDALAERVATTAGVRVRSVMLKRDWPGDAVREIADWGADLVVLASRGWGWWARVSRGSVGAELTRGATTPVLLVRGQAAPPDLAEVPDFGRVLVPLDRTARAERALGPAVALASVAGASCELIHVVRSRPYVRDWSIAHGSAPRAGQASAASLYLPRVAARVRGQGVPTQWRVVADVRPIADAILRHARSSGVSVIAMANRQRTGLSGMFSTSVAEKVARRAELPVLICPSDVIGLGA
jgi:nucleotide-binding universal stress UspA family protein